MIIVLSQQMMTYLDGMEINFDLMGSKSSMAALFCRLLETKPGPYLWCECCLIRLLRLASFWTDINNEHSTLCRKIVKRRKKLSQTPPSSYGRDRDRESRWSAGGSRLEIESVGQCQQSYVVMKGFPCPLLATSVSGPS